MTVLPDKSTTLESICPVSISEKDCRNTIKPVVIFNYMQDLAAKSIESYDRRFSCEELLKNGQGWFLIRYRIEFDDYFSHVDELKIKTECRGAQKMTTYRDFDVYDNITGSRILRACSSWFIVDLAAKSVVNILKEYPDFLQYEKRESDLVLRKLKSPDRFDAEKIFHVRYDDLDINNHVNNTVYIAWALEAAGYEFRTLHRLKSLDVYFKHEAKYGEDILSRIKYNSENFTTEHLITNISNGEDLCFLSAQWIKYTRTRQEPIYQI